MVLAGFLPFSQMAPEKQEAASCAFEQLGLPESTEVSASLDPAL